MATGNIGTTSEYFNLTLPGYDDDSDVDDFNTNFNILDTNLYDVAQDVSQNAADIATLRDSVGSGLIPFTGPNSGTISFQWVRHSDNKVYLDVYITGNHVFQIEATSSWPRTI